MAVLHSGLTIAERYNQWRLIRSAQVQIVVGARSAIFAPRWPERFRVRRGYPPREAPMVVDLILLLFFAAVYWGIKGDFVDFWDAFLWLVAFVFIELNVFDWRQEALEEQQLTASASV